MARQVKSKSEKLQLAIERNNKQEENILQLKLRLEQALKDAENNRKKNKRMLAYRLYDLFFEDTELGKIFNYNNGEIFTNDKKVDKLQQLFDDLAISILENDKIFKLKNVDFSKEEVVDDEISDEELINNIETDVNDSEEVNNEGISNF